MNWLLLRGLSREQRHWHGFPARLSRELGACRVHFLDLAGAGAQRERWPWPSVPWLARDVARRLLAFEHGIGRPWSVLGLSLGGMVALELCRLLPAHVRAAVIINSSSRLTAARARLRWATLGVVLARLAGDDPLEREQALLRVTSSLPEAERSRHAEVAARFGPEPRPLAVCSQLLAAARFSPPEPRALNARLLFMASRRDRLVDPRCSRDLASHYGAELAEHPWAGHDLPLDDPNWVCRHVAAFAAGAAGPAPWSDPRGTAPLAPRRC